MEQYKCQSCGKMISEDEGVTCVDGSWVCDKVSCRILGKDNEAHALISLDAAFKACYEGNFVSNIHLDSNESMHCYNGSLYYEDGANLTANRFNLSAEPWAKDGWYIKHLKCHIDQQKLAELHKEHDGMLPDGVSYECALLKGVVV